MQRHRFRDLARGKVVYAGTADLRGSGGYATHTHDYCEAMYVLEGDGRHEINGDVVRLRTAMLTFIRPRDAHAISVEPGKRLRLANVTFQTAGWMRFASLAGFDDRAAEWQSTQQPPMVRVPPTREAECRTAFETIVAGAATSAPDVLMLCRFWSDLLRFLVDLSPADRDSQLETVATPEWLRLACEALGDIRYLRMGVRGLVEVANVSPAHLSRTVRACLGMTPTELVNDARLRYAARSLLLTADRIDLIAADCGFESLSHFYRLFARRYGSTPAQFRADGDRRIGP